MKRTKFAFLVSAVSLLLTGCSTNHSGVWIFALLGIFTLLLGVLRVRSAMQYNKSRRRKRRKKSESPEQILLTVIIFVLALVFFLAAAVCGRSAFACT